MKPQLSDIIYWINRRDYVEVVLNMNVWIFVSTASVIIVSPSTSCHDSRHVIKHWRSILLFSFEKLSSINKKYWEDSSHPLLLCDFLEWEKRNPKFILENKLMFILIIEKSNLKLILANKLILILIEPKNKIAVTL